MNDRNRIEDIEIGLERNEGLTPEDGRFLLAHVDSLQQETDALSQQVYDLNRELLKMDKLLEALRKAKHAMEYKKMADGGPVIDAVRQALEEE